MDMFNDIYIKENKIIVMIFYDMDIVVKYVKCVVVLDKGYIVFDGFKEELFIYKDFDIFYLDYLILMKVLNYLYYILGYFKKLVLFNEEFFKYLKEV